LSEKERNVSKMSRRGFVGQAAMGLAAFAALGGKSAEAQLVYKRSDWNVKEFDELLRVPARAKQVYDATVIDSGKFLNNIKNSLNGLQFGFGIPAQQVRILAALHGAANMVNYDDYVWQKYRLGELLNETDPETGKPAVRNPYYPSNVPKNASHALEDERSIYQDTGVQGLQARGVKFLSCHTGLEEAAHLIVKRWKLSQGREEVAKDMLAHVHEGVLVVASMVASLVLLQSEGHYTYIKV
jgi:intracellular sulfur oxidation DsrE/DsrF family protein